MTDHEPKIQPDEDDIWAYSGLTTSLYPDHDARDSLDPQIETAQDFYDTALHDRFGHNNLYFKFHMNWLSHFRMPGADEATRKKAATYVNYLAQQAKIPGWRKSHPEYADMPKEILRDQLRRVERACKDMEKNSKETGKKAKKPKTKAEKYERCGDMRKSIAVAVDARMKLPVDEEARTVKLPKIKEPIPFGNTIRLPEGTVITKLTVGREWGKYDLAINYKYPRPVPVDITGKPHAGLDRGLRNTAALSDGSRPNRFNFTHKQIKRLAWLEGKKKHHQRKMSHMEKVRKQREEITGLEIPISNGYKKEQKKFNAVCKKISNILNNHCHQITAELYKEYGVIVIEDLKTRNLMMIGSAKTARRMAKTCWGKIGEMLRYKMGPDRVIVVPPHYTSQKCGNPKCGHKHRKNRNKEKFKCVKCGYSRHADVNAARNVLEAGMVSRPDLFHKSGP